MGGVDEVVREWLCHVLIHCLMLWVNGLVVFASKKAGEREKFQKMLSHQRIATIYLMNPAYERRLQLATKSADLFFEVYFL